MHPSVLNAYSKDLLEHSCSRSDHNHIVQFYENETFLLSSVCLFISSGLQKGEGAVIIATAEHCQAIELRLVKMNLSISQYKEQGQLVILDAKKMLSKFMEDKRPNRETFLSLFGGFINKMRSSFPNLRAYGEMVNVLCSEGNLKATLEVEELWNELLKDHALALLCGYTMDNFKHEHQETAFKEVCHTHSNVLPAENYSTLYDYKAQLQLIAELQQKALALQSEVQERKTLELTLRKKKEELRKAQEAAQAATRVKKSFLSNMGHELCTPLSAITGFAELILCSETGPEEIKGAAQIILRNGKNLSKTLNDLLDLSKIESTGLEIEKRRFSLMELIFDLSNFFGPRAKEKGIDFQIGFNGIIPKSIETDPKKLRQILVNIIDNAFKFTEKGKVEVQLQMDNPLNPNDSAILEVFVKDTGIGLTPNEALQLFQPFHQLDSSPARKFMGTGMGLYLSKQLVELLGGILILAESFPSQGSTFLLTIDAGPLWKMSFHPNSTPEKIGPKSGPRLKDQKVLLVEDSPDHRFLIECILNREGAMVDLARNGLEGLNKAIGGDYDVILMNIQMPILNGYEVIQELRQQDFQKPVIAFTAHSSKNEKARCLRAGFDDHLAKPVQREQIYSVLEKYLPH